jgi:hypothetical protein
VIITLFFCVVPLAHNVAGSRDFVAYWATGQQLVRHANPYDPDAMMRIERSAGLAPNGVLFMRNPPWALPLAIPLGFLGLRSAAILWSLGLLASLLVSVRLIWKIHGRPVNHLHWLGYSFAPALICILMGQTSLLALLGLVLFLRFHAARPFVAGIALWLCGLKPHLFLPFAIVLLAWVLVSRNYKVLAGIGSVMFASCAIVYCSDPMVWTQYVKMMSSREFDSAFIPCLSSALRFWIWPQATWLPYLPDAAACTWALTYFWHRRYRWDWIRDGSLLMLVSILAAPYCWLYDQGLAIPALLDGAYSTRSRKLLVVLALMTVLLYVELCVAKVSSGLYLWTAPAWFAWYLLARRAQ